MGNQVCWARGQRHGPERDNPERAPSLLSMLDAALQIGLVALLVYACSRIILPFTGILLWSVILAVMLYPLHQRLVVRVGNRWSALLIGLVGVAVMLVPMVMVVTSLGSSISCVCLGLARPQPDRAAAAATACRPAAGRPETDRDLGARRHQHAGGACQIRPDVKRACGMAGVVRGRLGRRRTVVRSFVRDRCRARRLWQGRRRIRQRLLERVTGSKAHGPRLVALTAATIRGVAVGVVGVAVIQSLLIGVGFFAIGLPAAGVLTLVVLLLAIVQVPAMLVTLPVIAYVLATEATTPAIIFSIWTLIAGLSDNVLKPLMLGRGLEVPMPVILIGVIGGMLADGLLGLFVGPVLLAVGYVLLIEWLRYDPVEGGPQIDGPPP